MKKELLRYATLLAFASINSRQEHHQANPRGEKGVMRCRKLFQSTMLANTAGLRAQGGV